MSWFGRVDVVVVVGGEVGDAVADEYYGVVVVDAVVVIADSVDAEVGDEDAVLVAAGELAKRRADCIVELVLEHRIHAKGSPSFLP